MDNDANLALRTRALELATSSAASMSEQPKRVTERAQEYYRFLKGEEPEHNGQD